MSESRAHLDIFWTTPEDILEGDIEQLLTQGTGSKATTGAVEQTRQLQPHGTPPTTLLTDAGPLRTARQRTTKKKGVFTKLAMSFVKDLYERIEIILLDGGHEERADPTSGPQDDMACPR